MVLVEAALPCPALPFDFRLSEGYERGLGSARLGALIGRSRPVWEAQDEPLATGSSLTEPPFLRGRKETAASRRAPVLIQITVAAILLGSFGPQKPVSFDVAGRCWKLRVACTLTSSSGKPIPCWCDIHFSMKSSIESHVPILLAAGNIFSSIQSIV